MSAKLDKTYLPAFVKGNFRLENCTVTVDAETNSVVILHENPQTELIFNTQIVDSYLKNKPTEKEGVV